MMKQTKNSNISSINPENIKPEEVKIITPDYFRAGKWQVPIDNTQIRQKVVIWFFTITGTWDNYLHIGFTPSLIEIKAYEDWHAPYSEAIIQAQENHCIYKDSGGNYAEAATNTVIYLSHAGATSAVLKSYWPLTKINVDSYNHNAIVHWIAHP